MKRRYKIALDSIGYYNVYYRYWWFPFWIKSNSWIKSFHSIEAAKEYIDKLENPVHL